MVDFANWFYLNLSLFNLIMFIAVMICVYGFACDIICCYNGWFCKLKEVIYVLGTIICLKMYFLAEIKKVTLFLK